MSDEPGPVPTGESDPNDESALGREVRRQAARKLKARRQAARGVWFGFGMSGLIGWSVVLPTLLGVALGIWLDEHYPARHSWTLTLLILGLVLGCWNAWHWVTKEQHGMRREEDTNDV